MHPLMLSFYDMIVYISQSASYLLRTPPPPHRTVYVFLGLQTNNTDPNNKSLLQSMLLPVHAPVDAFTLLYITTKLLLPASDTPPRPNISQSTCFYVSYQTI